MATAPVSSFAPTGTQVMFSELPTSAEVLPSGKGDANVRVPTLVAQKPGWPVVDDTTVASPKDVSTMYHEDCGVKLDVPA